MRPCAARASREVASRAVASRTGDKRVIKRDDAWHLICKEGAQEARIVEAGGDAERRSQLVRQQRVALQPEPANGHAAQLEGGRERDAIATEVEL